MFTDFDSVFQSAQVVNLGWQALEFKPEERTVFYCKPFQTLWGDDRAAIVSNFSYSESVILSIFADSSKMAWEQN